MLRKIRANLNGTDHVRNQPCRTVRQTGYAVVYLAGKRHLLLQAARQPVCGAGALAASADAAAGRGFTTSG
ncbi:hypothetical protein DCI99_25595, partial [Salmonella enterica subsp. enterica serovar Typhimurium]|nr:hypothetical protein [Salmonella enterica subsp. enterica serovar Typhimurium]